MCLKCPLSYIYKGINMHLIMKIQSKALKGIWGFVPTKLKQNAFKFAFSFEFAISTQARNKSTHSVSLFYITPPCLSSFSSNPQCQSHHKDTQREKTHTPTLRSPLVSNVTCIFYRQPFTPILFLNPRGHSG